MPTQYPVQPERYAERLKRLERLISLNAPPIIIEGECKLVMGATRGGYYRAMWAWFTQSIKSDIRLHIDTLKFKIERLKGKTAEEIADEEYEKLKNC